MNGDGPLIFIIAGEPSGDVLGARLMAALKQRTHGAVRFSGIGGDRMTGEGLDSLLPMRELSVMGYFEVVPKIPRILGHIRTAVEAARRLRPAAVVTIDAPDFSLRVQRRARRHRDQTDSLRRAAGLGASAGARGPHRPLSRSFAGRPAIRATLLRGGRFTL